MFDFWVCLAVCCCCLLLCRYVFKLVNPAMSAVLDPIAALIPGPLEPLMDVKDMAREVLESVVRESIDAVMEPGFSNELNKLDSACRVQGAVAVAVAVLCCGMMGGGAVVCVCARVHVVCAFVLRAV